MDKKELLSEAKGLAPYMSDCHRRLHRCPGVGFETEESLGFIKSELESMGIAAQRCGRAGLTALIGDGEKCLLLRADVDGLPMAEESGESFASENGCCHACGHDMHAAMLLGAAKLLKNRESELRGCVKLMFQSAEESLEGAKDMIAHGVLSSPKVDAAAMLHVMTGLPIPAGTLLLPPEGVSAPAADYFHIEVHGRGCHGSSPNTGIDPISAAAHILVALQELPARELGMAEAAVLTVGSIHGGGASNVIPNRVEMAGTLRAMEEDTREYVKTRLGEITEGIAATFRAEAELRFESGCPGLLNDTEMLDMARRCAVNALGQERVLRAGDFSRTGGRGGRTSGSEDFAYISRRVPSVMLALAAGEPEKGFDKPLHHPAARFDEAALPYGAAVLAQLAMEWGEEPYVMQP